MDVGLPSRRVLAGVVSTALALQVRPLAASAEVALAACTGRTPHDNAARQVNTSGSVSGITGISSSILEKDPVYTGYNSTGTFASDRLVSWSSGAQWAQLGWTKSNSTLAWLNEMCSSSSTCPSLRTTGSSGPRRPWAHQPGMRFFNRVAFNIRLLCGWNSLQDLHRVIHAQSVPSLRRDTRLGRSNAWAYLFPRDVCEHPILRGFDQLLGQLIAFVQLAVRRFEKIPIHGKVRVGDTACP